MTREVVIIGASGFAKEMVFLLENSIAQDEEEWDIKGFIDENTSGEVLGYKVLGNDDWLLQYDREINVVVGIGDSKVKQRVVKKLKENKNIKFPNIIAKSVRLGKNVAMGEGCIICDMNILTVDVCLGDFVTLNLNNTIGHDTVIGSFTTVNPGCNISGNVNIGKSVMVGTGTKIIQGLEIGDEAIIGAGTVIIRNVEEKCTVVGNPGRMIKKCQSQ